ENPLGPSPNAISAMKDVMGDLGLYPDGNGFYLKQRLADLHNVDMSQITLGNGSNDILELVARSFLTENTDAIYSQYAFLVYALAVKAVNANAIVVPARDWGHDLDAMLNAVTDSTRVVFLANPNNPTGTCLPASAIESFVSAVSDDVIVVVDEAYHEYVEMPGYESAMDLVEHHPNLVVTRTFSKAYGLAGLRIGYGVSHPAVSNVLNRVRQPFNVNSLALAAADAALQDQDHINKSVELNRTGMQFLCEQFSEMGIKYIPSSGNFVCVELGARAAEINEELLKRGVIVRPVDNYGMPHHLRITIGNNEQNTRFINSLKEII
ncbi:MAG: histidinol-phosphate transaminase, partial [Gammaproteobacteria bacterium]|nr:histidinol-phosphate transaminase [Gammaproteobacteria bacterium]